MNLHIQNGWMPERGTVHIDIESGLIRRIVAPPDAIAPVPGTKTIDARGMAVLPGLVNGHTHGAMTLLRGYGDGLPLDRWLQTRIWPAEARMSAEDVYWGARLACLEMIRAGTVRFMDGYWHFHANARAAEESGLRAGIGLPLIDVAGEAQGAACRRLAEQAIAEAGRYSERIQPVLSPHAAHTVSPGLLEWAAGFAETHRLPVQIHLSETRAEVASCLRDHQVRPSMHLERQGLLTERTLLAHGVHLDESELDLIAARGATLVTNPASNMKLAVGGVFPYPAVRARGIPVALGSDGASSNNSLDLFADLKLFSLIQTHAAGDATLLPAAEALAIARGARAPLLGQSGRIAPGEPADLILLRRDAPEMTPQHDFNSNLVYAANSALVDTVVVAGRVLMRNRRIPDESEIRREAAARAHALCAG